MEIQRTEQVGLSFRIFEALGHRKKLITTNKDIVNYDFYHPQNILVVDENTIEIPEEFVTSPYVEIEPAHQYSDLLGNVHLHSQSFLPYHNSQKVLTLPYN